MEDMVLDIEKYANLHPGGTFLIEHNIGKDISKYFYGGYSLEPSKIPHGHTHSQNARQIVNDLAIGVYVNHSQSQQYIIDEKDSFNVNALIRSICFKSTGMTAYGTKY